MNGPATTPGPSARLRVAWVVGGLHAGPDDPFAPYLATSLRGLAKHAEVVAFPLRYPVAQVPYSLFGARVEPQSIGDVRLRESPALWRSVVRSIVQAHRRRPFDLVHAVQAAEPGFVASLAAARIGRPLVAQVLGGELVDLADIGFGGKQDRAGRWFVASTLRRAARVVVLSDESAGAARARLGSARADRIRIAPLPVEMDRFRPRLLRTRRAQLRAGEAPCRLLAVANLLPVKDHATLLRAFAQLAALRPDVRLHLVGGGPTLAALRRQASELGVAERVQWWGQVPHAAVHVAFAGADAYVSSSRHEAQGVALLEAASCGLPVAATAVGAARELPPSLVHRCRPGSVEGLLAAMADALQSAPAPRASRRAVRDLLRPRWSEAACAQRMLAVWREIAAS